MGEDCSGGGVSGGGVESSGDYGWRLQVSLRALPVWKLGSHVTCQDAQ